MRDPQALYNCCTDFTPPNWGDFTALEIGGCTQTVEDDGSTVTEGGASDSEAQFWTVYGRCKWGGCDAITDCATRAAADDAAAELSRISSLPIS